MSEFDGNGGINRLANVLSRRICKTMDGPLIVDFGEIQTNGSLSTNTFPVPVPKGMYSILEGLSGGSLKAGDRVLVAWVQNEAVVIGKVTGS